MAERKPTVGSRISTLEDKVVELERTTAQLRTDQQQTQAQIEDLRNLVEAVPAQMTDAIDRQTDDFRVIVAESETRNADRITDAVRQWPAGAIIAATVGLGVVVDLLAAAAHLPHLS